VLRANLLFRAVIAPAGVHDVVFEYEPTEWRAGLVAAVAAGLVLFALLIIAAIRTRRSTRGKQSDLDLVS